MWFEELMGFEEVSPSHVKKNIRVEGDKLISRVNGKTYQFGKLEVPTLKDLKARSINDPYKGDLQVEEVVGNVQELHQLEENRNALFQVASQFNLLEMLGPHVSPEKGVGIYEKDYTQGPACAIACGAGTIYRNYFAPVNLAIGQTLNNQIDCLELIGEELDNDESQLWRMINGYALCSQEGLHQINFLINNLNEEERETLKEKLKIGVQWNTEVTISNEQQIVSQAFCSALPVAYSGFDSFYFESFARLILEASYEATLHSALINLDQNYSNKVFLTLVGGGAFGNETDWIVESLLIALKKFRNTPLDVKIVSYSGSKIEVQELIKSLNTTL
ncbi:hypothetical protein [Flammeovirga sp. SJP92]|uniref:hypothetical protein n=1 Tax=Flammeovirga sp. SJP92 TaxID=1775430 RepID=UPI0007877085|nr:hypothetical protein [Flammeovirga sp. SJP92]KXX66814.1 hypothetical protein AVL50_30235 [Flammeovirga sp. SJP92]